MKTVITPLVSVSKLRLRENLTYPGQMSHSRGFIEKTEGLDSRPMAEMQIR
jgi:hypothetical protein